MKLKREHKIMAGMMALFALNYGAQTQTVSMVNFTDQGSVRISDVGRSRLGYPVCGPNGVVYITSMIDPNASADTRLVSVATDGSIVDYNVSSTQGLIKAFVRSVAADEAGAYVLVDALPNPGDSSFSELRGKNQFLVHYNLAGKRQALHGLSADFSYQRIASQSRESLLALRIEKSSGNLSVVSLNPNGTVLKTIDMKGEILPSAEVDSFLATLGVEGMESAPPAGKMETAASPIQLQTIGGAVVLVKPGIDNRVYLIDEHGAVNSIHLETPAGVDPRSVFPDPELGLTMLTFGPGQRDASLLRFDPVTGKESGEVKITGMALTSSICKHASKYYGIRVDHTGATLMIGSLTKTN